MIQTPKKKISAKEENQIVTAITLGETAGQIATKFNIKKQDVSDIAIKNKIILNRDIVSQDDLFGRVQPRKKSVTPSRVYETQIIELINKQVSVNDIAKKFDLTESTVRTVARRNGIKLRSAEHERLQLRDEKIKIMLEKGKTLTEIGYKLKITKERVRQIAQEKFGIKRREESHEYYTKMVSDIKADIEGGLSHDEILKKHKLNKNLLTSLSRFGLPSLSDIFKEKRNAIILDELKKGKTATEILNSKNKFLKGKSRLTTVDRIYGIASENNLYKFPTVGNRTLGGCFEDESILKLIVSWREEQKLSFDKISATLNEWGKKTLTGCTFSPANVRAKYFMVKKHQ